MRARSPEATAGTAGLLRRPSLQIGRPSAEQIKTALTRLTYRPDDRGVCHEVWGWNCMAGHADFPGRIYWFVTADGRLVRYVYPATHGYFAAPLPEPEHFTKQPTPRPEGGDEGR